MISDTSPDFNGILGYSNNVDDFKGVHTSIVVVSRVRVLGLRCWSPRNTTLFFISGDVSLSPIQVGSFFARWK